jgi:molybdopterin-guanine dinucleotide biosynthesis protein B
MTSQYNQARGIEMRVFGISGHSGMGKTTLLELLVPAFNARGMVVSVIKHTHKDLDIDRPGKDSYRLRETGCQEVLVMGRRRWVLMHELSDDSEPTLPQLLDKLQACDLVLIEGFKQGEFPKLEVWRAAVDKSPLWPTLPGLIAVASDDSIAPFGMPVLPLSDITSIVEFIVQHAAINRISELKEAPNGL